MPRSKRKSTKPVPRAAKIVERYTFLITLTPDEIVMLDEFLDEARRVHVATSPKVTQDEVNQSKMILAESGIDAANAYLKKCKREANKRHGRMPSRTAFLYTLIQLGLKTYERSMADQRRAALAAQRS